MDLKDVDAVILCGGRGERLKSVVSGRPKALALVRGKPLLDIILEKFYDAGVRRFVLCVGYLKEQIHEHVARIQNSGSPLSSAEFVFSEEDEPLGTGGALKNAAPHIKGECFLLVNGDCLWNFNFKELYNRHKQSGSIVSLTLTPGEPGGSYGQVVLAENGLVSNFFEKRVIKSKGFISAGTYFMNRDIFSHFPAAPAFSLEYDVFPVLAEKNLCYGIVVESAFIDIGTPERYASAGEFFS